VDLPANQALNCIPSSTYALVATAKRRLLMLAADLREACLPRYKLQGEQPLPLATCQGCGARAHRSSATRSTTGLAGLSRRVRHARHRHRHRALAPAYGVEDFLSCRATA
jgi:isoleucyl-tRNA synthetase